jgi:hypothetical protein
MEDACYFRQKAEQCRRLAATLIERNDPTKERLLALALEFDAKALAAAAEEASRRQMTACSSHGAM